MLIKCRDVVRLPSLKKLKIVAGATGLDRIVRWVHVLDMPDVANWVRGGELLFMTGMSLKCPMDLLAIVRDIAAKNLAGLVITPGKYIPAIPSEVLNLADGLGFPIFELPWEVKLVEVFEEVANYINHKQADEKSMQDILKNLVFGDIDNPEFLAKRATYYGFDINEPCQVVIVRINNLEEYLLLKKCSTENAIIEIKERFKQAVVDVLVRNNVEPIYLVWLDSLIVFLPVKKQIKLASENNLKIANKSIDELNQILPGLKIYVGLGNLGSGPMGIRKSLHQAEQALKFGIISGESNIFAYEQMGINKLLFAVPQDVLQSFYQNYILVLKNYDADHSTTLVHDLEVFLQYNGNFGLAAKSLFIHRNTLIYRMKKVEELTGKPLNDFQNCICFYIGIMTGKYRL